MTLPAVVVALLALAEDRPKPPPPRGHVNLTFESPECGSLDRVKLTDAVSVELTSHPPSEWLSNIEIRLSCAERMARIEVLGRDELPFVRAVPEPEGIGRERTLALAISEVVLAADERHRSRAESPPAPAPPAAPKPVIIEQAAPPPPPPAPPPPDEPVAAVSAQGIGRARALPEPLLCIGAGLRVDLPLSNRWAVLLVAEAETGSDEVTGGRVRYRAVGGQVGLAGKFRRERSIGFELHALVGGGWAEVGGEPDTRTVSGATLTDGTVTAIGGLGPVLDVGGVLLALSLEGGWTSLGPIGGVVSDRGPPLVRSEVSFGGAWAGVALRLGGELR